MTIQYQNTQNIFTNWFDIISQVKGTTFTAKGLQPDIGYEFRVTAANKAGPGAPSSPSCPIKYEEQIQFITDLQDVRVRTVHYQYQFCE